jgi:hypothetical protein
VSFAEINTLERWSEKSQSGPAILTWWGLFTEMVRIVSHLLNTLTQAPTGIIYYIYLFCRLLAWLFHIKFHFCDDTGLSLFNVIIITKLPVNTSHFFKFFPLMTLFTERLRESASNVCHHDIRSRLAFQRLTSFLRVERVIHSVLACRVILHIRQQGRVQQLRRLGLYGENYSGGWNTVNSQMEVFVAY